MTITLKAPWAIILSLLLLFFILLNVKASLQCYSFGLVDIQALVSIEAERLAHRYPDGKVPLDKLQALSAHLRETLQQFAQKRRVILFAKGSVYSGDLQDYTEIIKKELEDE